MNVREFFEKFIVAEGMGKSVSGEGGGEGELVSCEVRMFFPVTRNPYAAFSKPYSRDVMSTFLKASSIFSGRGKLSFSFDK